MRLTNDTHKNTHAWLTEWVIYIYIRFKLFPQMHPQEPIHHTYQVQPWRLIPCPTQDLPHISQNQRLDKRMDFSGACPQYIKQILWQTLKNAFVRRTAVNIEHVSGCTLIISGFTEMFKLAMATALVLYGTE